MATVTLHFSSQTLNPNNVLSDPAEFNNLTKGGSVTLMLEGVSNTILDYDTHSGAYTTTETLSSDVKFRQFIPSSAAIDSLVVGVEPDSDLSDYDVTGVWGLVDEIEDSRNPVLDEPVFGFGVTILASFDDYGTVSAVETDLEV